MILLAVARQEPAVDFRSAAEAGLVALPDKEVLATAAEAGRVLVRHDLKTTRVGAPGNAWPFCDPLAGPDSALSAILPSGGPYGCPVPDLRPSGAMRCACWIER